MDCKIGKITFIKEGDYIAVYTPYQEMDRIPIKVTDEEKFKKICKDYYETSPVTKVDREEEKKILINEEVKMTPEFEGAYKFLQGVAPKCQLLGEYAGIDENGDESMGIFINTPNGFNFTTLIRYKDGGIKLLSMDGEPLSFI